MNYFLATLNVLCMLSIFGLACGLATFKEVSLLKAVFLKLSQATKDTLRLIS